LSLKIKTDLVPLLKGIPYLASEGKNYFCDPPTKIAERDKKETFAVVTLILFVSNKTRVTARNALRKFVIVGMNNNTEVCGWSSQQPDAN